MRWFFWACLCSAVLTGYTFPECRSESQTPNRGGCFGRGTSGSCSPDSSATKRTQRKDAQKNVSSKTKHPSGPRYAKVVSSRFIPVSGNQGVWSGVVAGNGRVHLNLNILKGRVTHTRKYMGQVVLNNKTSTFKFKTALPDFPGWRWRIVAASG